MTLQAVQLIAPAGKLQEDLFPEGVLVGHIETWLNTAYTKTGDLTGAARDAAAEHYVYYLAYSHVADRLAGEPNEATVDSAGRVSRTIDRDRIAHFKRLADDHLEQFKANFADAPAGDTPRSSYVQTKVIF